MTTPEQAASDLFDWMKTEMPHPEELRKGLQRFARDQRRKGAKDMVEHVYMGLHNQGAFDDAAKWVSQNIRIEQVLPTDDQEGE